MRLLLALVVVHGHGRALARQMTADGASDPARAAGYQRHVAAQGKHEMRRRERRADRVISKWIRGDLSLASGTASALGRCLLTIGSPRQSLTSTTDIRGRASR